MTTSELIKKLESLADIGVVNAKEDKKTLMEAAARLYHMREKLDPDWHMWMIEDDGLFLERMHGEESAWTADKDDAVHFDSEEDAQNYIDNFLGDGCPVLRGDCEPIEVIEIEIASFNCDDKTFPSA